MDLRILFLLTIVALSTFSNAQEILNLLRDERFVEKQINCVLNRGHCDIIGRKIKSKVWDIRWNKLISLFIFLKLQWSFFAGLLPEALNNNCRGCTSRDITHARILMDFMQRNYPNEWYLIRQHYAVMPNYGTNNWGSR